MYGLGSRHTGGLKPFRPILSIVEMQQGELQDIGQLAQAVTSRKEFGTADRKQLLGAHPHDVEPRPIAVAMPDRQIYFLSGEVDRMHRRWDPKIGVGMGLGKSSKPMYQPFRCKVRRCAHGQNTRTLALHETVSTHRDPIERIAHDTQIFAPSSRYQ